MITNPPFQILVVYQFKERFNSIFCKFDVVCQLLMIFQGNYVFDPFDCTNDYKTFLRF